MHASAQTKMVAAAVCPDVHSFQDAVDPYVRRTPVRSCTAIQPWSKYVLISLEANNKLTCLHILPSALVISM